MNRLRKWWWGPLLRLETMREDRVLAKLEAMEYRWLRRMDELQAAAACKVVPMAVHKIETKLPEPQPEWMKEVDWERVNGGQR